MTNDDKEISVSLKEKTGSITLCEVLLSGIETQDSGGTHYEDLRAKGEVPWLLCLSMAIAVIAVIMQS